MRIGTRTSCACFAFGQACGAHAGGGVQRTTLSGVYGWGVFRGGACWGCHAPSSGGGVTWLVGEARASPHLPPQAVTCKFVTMQTGNDAD